ncbi:MAG: ATP-binding cassette domain-containing protein [Rhodospirillaceae bacterium]|nr:MAG: ATP-binding cassette domain-containing protein [Rhodospirillaceae bacterium]
MAPDTTVPPEDPMVLRGIVKSYGALASSPLILDGIDLTLHDGQILAILGQSGCGKSTLLRIIAGLIPPSRGSALYRGHQIQGPTAGIAMVFQSFALFPWLTVMENVAFGLEAQGVGAVERRARSMKAIELIGLDGYENAYPKELSGGMRQRVGFARALVVDPDILLLDEPFSALDVLTAENLRGDLIDLWNDRRIPTRAIVFVSHNIQEAVEVSDRIIVLSSHPGRVRADMQITLPHPRNPDSEEFKTVVDNIYRELAVGVARAHGLAARADAPIGIAHRLPQAGIQPLLGLIDAIDSTPFNGKADLADVAESESLEMDQLLQLVEGLQLLGFATITDMTVALNAAARGFHDAEIPDRKRIFGEHLVRHVPLIRHIRHVLTSRADHTAPETRFLAELQDHLPSDQSQAILDTAINWARFSELFSYDYDTGMLSLDPPET